MYVFKLIGVGLSDFVGHLSEYFFVFVEDGIIMGLDDFFKDHISDFQEDNNILKNLLNDRKTSEIALVLSYPIEG